MAKVSDMLRKSILDYAHERMVDAAKGFERQLTNHYGLCLARFYGEYTPKIYKRTDNLAAGSWRPVFEDKGSKVAGGVSISASNMDSVYNAPPGMVLKTALDGWHGPPTAGIAGTPMLPEMEAFRDSLADNFHF